MRYAQFVLIPFHYFHSPHLPPCAVAFCSAHVELHALKSQAKYLKKQLERLETAAAGAAADDKAAAPRTRTTADPNVVRDFYVAPELQVKIAKCSTIPTINDKLLAKLDAGTALTLPESLLLDVHRALKSLPPSLNKQVWLTSRVADTAAEVGRLTTYLEEAKMAILIGNAWFSDVDASVKTFSVQFKDQAFQVTVEVNDVNVYMS